MQGSGTASSGSAVGSLLDGRYLVESVLARGGMSTVYRGVDVRLERPVAIKVMDPRFAGDPSFLDRFIREARATARLRHPSVVAVHDQGVDHDHVFLVMELVDGGTLRDLLRSRHRLPLPLALAVLDPVLSALAAAHRDGLVHRDIKPENVLIGRGGEVKVGDFGLVRAVAEAGSTSGSVILGTVAYLSPEQVATGAADARSDVYAAGIVLFEMLTGRPPYVGDTALSVAYRHVNDDVPAPSTLCPAVPPQVDQLVVSATRRDPRSRPPDAAAFLLGLQRVRAALGVRRVPVSAPVPGDDETPTEPARQLPRPADHPGPQGTRALTRPHQPNAKPSFQPNSGPPSPPRPPARRREQPADPYLLARARDRRIFVFWLVVVLLLASLVGYGAWHLAIGSWTTVPPLDSLDRRGVELALQEAGLDAQITGDHHDMVPAGRLVSSDPESGTRIMRGRTVDVVISQGRPRVPNIGVGASLEMVRADLADADLKLRRNERSDAYHDTVPEGGLLKLTPPPGTELTVGAEVTVALSKGPPPVAVPDVRGRTIEEAVAALKAAGLQVSGEPTRRFDRNVASGLVIATEPQAGEQTPKGSDVELVVSTALVVPEVAGMPREQAVKALRDAGFAPLESGDGAGKDGARAVRTDPDAGSLVDPADNRVRVQLSMTVPVPMVMGKSVDEARQALAKHGLRVEVSQLFGDESSTVVGQHPGPGTHVPPGTVVVLSAFP